MPLVKQEHLRLGRGCCSRVQVVAVTGGAALTTRISQLLSVSQSNRDFIFFFLIYFCIVLD